MSSSVAVWHKCKGVSIVSEAPKTRCASVLKPVYAWVSEHPRWGDLAEKAVTASDNEATDELTQEDPVALARRVERRTWVDLAPAETWGRFQVDATDIARMYYSLDVSMDEKADHIKQLMGKVDAGQSFGFHGMMKAGWDMYVDSRLMPRLVTNIVIMGVRGGVAVTTDTVIDKSVARDWKNKCAISPSSVIPLHLAALESPRLQDLVGRGLSRLVAM